MPRNGQSMLFGSGGSYYLRTSVSITNTNIVPMVGSSEEVTQFSEVRNLIAETMSRIIRRDPNTNSILANIAIGRSKLSELATKK